MITDISKVNERWVYQNNKLIEASYSFTVLEQKLIRLLASMIKKDDEEFKSYSFKAIDLCKILNVHPKNIYMELDQITDKLMTRYIKIKDTEHEKFQKRHLIKIADFENGILNLKIDEDMKEFYLKLNWYTKYQLKNIMQFKSTYSFRLYELLKQYQKIGYRILNIEDLRFILDINKKQYPKYANLKQKVLSVAIKEINNKTDLSIELEEIKEVRKVVSVKFTIHSNNAVQNELAVDSHISQGRSDEVKEVQTLLYKHNITETESELLLNDAKDDITLIKKCYEYLLTKNVENVVGYMRILVKEYNEPQRNTSGNFNNYNQREYDFDKLERALLGWND